MNLHLSSSESVLRFEVIKVLIEELNIPVQHGFLMSRDRIGIPLREYLMNQLQNKMAEVYLLDFRGVDEMTTSVAEELGPHLIENFLSIFNESKADNKPIFLTYCNLSKEVRNGLDTAMKTWPSKTSSAKKIVAVAFNQNIGNQAPDFFVLGELPDALRETIFQIYQLDEVKSTDLDKLGIKASSRKLSELMEDYPWLVRQEKQRLTGTSKAWSYVYKPIFKYFRNCNYMSDPLPNLEVVAQNFALMRNTPPDSSILAEMLATLFSVTEKVPSKPVAGIDSSDNLLLSIPDHPGAAVAGYSFALVIMDNNGKIKHIQDRIAERAGTDQIEDLEISLVYNIPLPERQKLLHISDYQLRILINTPSSQSPYGFTDQIPEYKVRFAAARQRETIERRATRNSFFLPDVSFGLFLKDGRLNSQNVSTRYTDDIGRKAVERGIRYVGVVKAGTLLWSALYPYHKAIYQQRQSPYWVVIPPKIILRAYGATMQPELKTLRLGAQENRCLGGIGGAWILYGNGLSNFFILEFNVYDLQEYKAIATNGVPLERFNNAQYGWKDTYIVSRSEYGSFIGTQTLISSIDLENLIDPTIGEIHYLSKISYISPGYPLALADAHNRCKITKDRKEQINVRLIARLSQLGFHPVDFETWSEDPHKTFADN